MTKYLIHGGKQLHGEIEISGAKNAAVAILPAALLVNGKCRIENVPQISDVTLILQTMKALGADVRTVNKTTVEIDCSHIQNQAVPYELARKIRASYYLVGALLGRFGWAQVPPPGGCNLGGRPIDQHLKGFRALGADADVRGGLIDAVASNGRLKGGQVYLDVVSVGATMNTMLAATLAEGMTIIENAAKEPHIVDLANFLNTMGAHITGAGTDTVKVWGVDALQGGTYAIIPDQIEAGTYMAAAAATGGDILVKNVIPKHMECITSKLAEMGAEVTNYDDCIRIRSTGRLSGATVKTRPYPGFPTDMQAQICVCMALAGGISKLTESVYETRFFGYCSELEIMGAEIHIDGKTATVYGKDSLHGATVRARDLRAGAALIIAGLAAEGTTRVENIHYVERGYERLIEKLTALGAKIRRVEEN